MSAQTKLFWCDYALLTDSRTAIRQGVVIETNGGIIASISQRAKAPAEATLLPGLTIPGLANAHSHAFHRVLRGRTHGSPPASSTPHLSTPHLSTPHLSTPHLSTPRQASPQEAGRQEAGPEKHRTGSFWTWREQMYDVAQQLDPANYRRLARAVFGEMALAGITVVGEFHYVHHQPDGSPYTDPNAMGNAILDAAAEVGIRITLLDTCYLHGGIGAHGHHELSVEQARFSDGTVGSWIERMDQRRLSPSNQTSRVGAAIHSVRAMTGVEIQILGQYTAEQHMPVHVHLSETLVEDEQTTSAFGVRPAEMLQQAGVISDQLTAIHGTHATSSDISILSKGNAGVCFCPTTERDLADGIGPSLAMVEAGMRLSVGSDSNAVIDLFEEVRAIELHERLRGHERGNHSVAALMNMASANGYQALGWDNGGRIGVGNLADFISVRLDSVRTAGANPATALATIIYAASPTDVDTVVVNAEVIVQSHQHRSRDVPKDLASAIEEFTRGV